MLIRLWHNGKMNLLFLLSGLARGKGQENEEGAKVCCFSRLILTPLFEEGFDSPKGGSQGSKLAVILFFRSLFAGTVGTKHERC